MLTPGKLSQLIDTKAGEEWHAPIAARQLVNSGLRRPSRRTASIADRLNDLTRSSSSAWSAVANSIHPIGTAPRTAAWNRLTNWRTTHHLQPGGNSQRNDGRLTLKRQPCCHWRRPLAKDWRPDIGGCRTHNHSNADLLGALPYQCQRERFAKVRETGIPKRNSPDALSANHGTLDSPANGSTRPQSLRPFHDGRSHLLRREPYAPADRGRWTRFLAGLRRRDT